MTVDRRTLLAAAAASALTTSLSGCASPQTTGANDSTVSPAALERSQGSGAVFVPGGGYPNLAAEYDYVEEEWFASGRDDAGQDYKTQIFVRRPRDPARFTGTVIVEPLHVASAGPIFIYTGRYIMRSGHGWACVASQKSPLDSAVIPTNPQRYASLRIAPTPGTTMPALPTGAPETPEQQAARRAAMENYNQASNAILAQAGVALRSADGPFGNVRHVILAGHSQTGGVVTNYINNMHMTRRRAGGAPIYDGLLPTGAARNPFAPRDVPLIQVLSEADIDDPARSNGRAYRRDDSDAPNDRYRLYELAGAPHMGTRYPPYDSAAMWASMGIPAGTRMSSYPHHELFCVGMGHLVKWVVDGTAPPRGARIDTDANGAFVKDENGNSRGGVRCAQMDVPHITYHPDPVGAQAVVGTETPFDARKMRQLYQTQANYVRRFNARLDELIAQGWFLTEDAAGMRTEAANVRF
jgi:hypothetical protein